MSSQRIILEQYYDSDDDIAWGPLTLREIKRELATKRSAKQRHTIHLVSSQLDDTVYHTAEEDCSKAADDIKNQDFSKTMSTNYDTINDSRLERIQEISDIEERVEVIDISISSDSDNKENIDDDSRLMVVKREKLSFIAETTNSGIETIDLCSDNELSSRIDDYSTDNSTKFNDTLEEMEQALKELQIPTSSRCITNTNSNDPNLITKRKPPTVNKYDYIASPVGEYIRKKSPTVDRFKTPKPLTKRTVTTPLHFRNIISPVAVYIKTTPTAPLRQNVQSNTKLCFTENHFKTPTVSSSSDELPKAIYKPPKKIVQTDIDGPHLPQSIKKTVTLPTVTMHLKRNKAIDGSVIDRITDEDLTLVGDTTVDNSTIDVSIHQNKQIFIK